MKIRFSILAGFAFALASCTTTASMSGDALSARWVGKDAGKFFAAYGPPTGDDDSASATVYNWKGGYKTRRTPAQYTGTGKNKKLVARARSEYLVCQVKITTGSDYKIRSITRILDKPGVAGGPSWCEEFLDAAKS